jgi:DNA polymerase III delta subunit
MLNRQLRLVWQAKLFHEAKASPTSPPEAIKAQLPAVHSLLSQKEYPQRIAMQAASKVSRAQLTRCFELLAESEARIKGTDAMFSTSDTLDQMVLEMTQIVSRPTAQAK